MSDATGPAAAPSAASDTACPRATLLGLGNPLYGDDGAGVEAIRLFQARYRCPAALEVVDGGTQGLGLLGVIEETPALLILDAVVGEAQPGTVVELEVADLMGGSCLKLSEHQVHIGEVIALAAWRGRLPGRLRLIGVVAGRLDVGIGLSEPVRRALPTVVESAVAWLRRWGMPVEASAAVGPPHGAGPGGA